MNPLRITTLFLQDSQIRVVAQSGNAMRLEGLAVPFDDWALLSENPLRREMVARAAFADTLSAVQSGAMDIRLLVDHDPSRLLARTRNGSLRLQETGQGLAFTADLPDTTLARDIHAMAGQDLLGGMSIGFDGRRSLAAQSTDKADGARLQVLQRVALEEVSIATSRPAYVETFVAARMLGSDSYSQQDENTLKDDVRKWLCQVM